MTSGALAQGILAFEIFVVLYFLVLNSLYLLFSLAAYLKLRQHRRRWTPRALGAVMRSPATPGISLIVPAYNEAFTVVDSVRSLLLLNYPRFEVIVVNDASTDNTLEALVDAFDLVRAPASFVALLPSRSITGVYKSLTSRDLVILDKEQGGKSDALNAGINVARYPLVCVMDADSLLEEHSLTRMVLPFLEDPDTVAVGGIVRIANGCTVESGRIAEVGLSGSRLARFQVVEYLRAFLAGRVAWSLLNGLLIVSGAFGLFRRDVLINAGGFGKETVTEDMELIVRLHHWCRRRGQRYRIVFQPDPVCWTEAPESLRVLARQRNRWQRGMLQVLGRYKGMTLNPRYGIVGLVSIPYHLLFEALGPLVEVGGYMVVFLALFLGLLDWRLAQLFFLVAVVYGTLISLAAVLLEELSFRRYPRVSDLLTLTLYGCLENFGYRQLTSWWRITGLFDFLRHRQHWGPMTRTGFRTGAIALALLVPPATARAQADIIALARTASAEGRRVQALTMLEQHLTQSPEDVDARLVYGLVLSWEGRYDEARRELQRVLAQTPAYLDARIALMNVELWSGHRQAADAQADEILSREPGNPQARLVRRRLDALGRAWTANVGYSHDRFSDGRGSWHEQAVSLSRSTPIGPIVARGTRAQRFSLTDEQVELELYPAFRAGTYAFVGLGVAPDAALYPHHRVAFDLYQGLGRGVEVSAGYRRLEFTEVTHIYLVTVTKYVGTWMTTGKVYHVPGRATVDPTSYHGMARRYFGADGTSFVGFGYGHGLSREEVRSLGDLVTVAFDTVRGQVDVAVTARWRLQLDTSTSRQEQSWGTVWQTAVGTGLSLRF